MAIDKLDESRFPQPIGHKGKTVTLTAFTFKAKRRLFKSLIKL